MTENTITFDNEEIDKLDEQNNDNDNDNDEINGDYFQDILNIYIQYYKKAYPEKNITSLFHDVNFNDPTSTNHVMEIFFEEMLKYKKIDAKLYTSQDIIADIIKKDNIVYGLQIDGEIKCVAISVITLIIEINDKYKKNIWNIICLS